MIYSSSIMFRRKIEVKSCTLLKTSEKKKFRTLLSTTFFRKDSNTSPEGEDDEAMPDDFRSALVKGELALTKAVTDNGNRHFEFYSLDKTPILFAEDGRLYPTVYLLWTLPNIVPRIYTHAEVFEKLKSGAVLMLPGVITSSAMATSCDFSSNATCAICVAGNDAAMGVGQTLMSGAEMVNCEVKKGKAVHVLHTYQDYFWELGPKIRVPIISLPRQSSQHQAEEDVAGASVNAAADAIDASLSFSDAVPVPPAVDDDLVPTPELGNDTLFLLYFLYALQKRLRHDDELPMLASTFYGNILLPLMPSDENKKITIQRTTFKKFSVFLRHMQEEGVIAIDEPKKGVENIARINREHDIFGQYSAQLKTLHTADRSQEPSDAASSTVNERPVNFRELRAITASVLPLFQEVNKALRRGQALSAVDVRSVITAYVKAKELADGRAVKLDDVLLRCTTMSSNDQRAVGDPITWDKLMDSIFNKMTPCIEIEYVGQGASATEGSRKQVRKGKPPTIRMRVAKRAGNKKVTMIDNIQEFGIDPKTFAQEMQVALAVSATLNDSPGFSGPQVQVQGDQSTALQKILVEKYGIVKKYIQVG